MNNETLERLRLPGAWVLVGAAGASMLSGLISLIAGSSGYRSSFASAMVSSAPSFFSFHIVVLLAVAVALVVTSPRTRPSASPIVLVSLIMIGVGLLFALINLITEFVWAAGNEAGNMGFGFAGFVSTLGSGAVLGILGFVLLKVFSDPALVPRAMPQQAQYPQQQFPPMTGAQQSFAQPGYPVQDPNAQAVADPTQTASGQQQGYGQYGVDAAAQQQAAYGQQYGTGAQQGYGQYGADAAAQQQAYDAQQQAAYGQAYDPSQYAPQGTEQPASGEQAAQDAIQYGWYQGTEQGQQAQDTPPEAGVEPFFNSGENTGTETPGQGGGSYGGQYGSGTGYGSDQQGQSGSGDQQGWYGGEDKR